ncbi:hypothetical protein [Mycobacterium attenuatum]|uniref:hypothetical protein n=1 Tax=Mycobacterium attenuatum TaxID=2341086 RepID=UPI000F024730|nr:hypothetical protein [Mycobacterium attenuatum]VBA45437.1 hypothetical protein LAUMK41_00140 [Mycobacterium attenuatum]
MDGPAIGRTTRPHWLRTGYKFFPYAAHQSGQWWVLRLNHGFPEHDLYTLFIDGRAVADITGELDDRSPLVAAVAVLKPYDHEAAEPVLDAEAAAAVVNTVSCYVNYGSEYDKPCNYCSDNYDGMAQS